ncbi:MAG: hypothetical protein MR210_09780 [Erysipelotrichaceae bacterium]|nr:hypothetical protein [Erysipelotrichaceae bacterium]
MLQKVMVNDSETLSNDKQVCTINKEGECECTDISVNPPKLEGQEGVD